MIAPEDQPFIDAVAEVMFTFITQMSCTQVALEKLSAKYGHTELALAIAKALEKKDLPSWVPSQMDMVESMLMGMERSV